MFSNYHEVHFEQTDPFISIIDTDSKYDDIIKRAKKLCSVFDFDFKLKRATIDDEPNLMFSIGINPTFINYQHYLNVLFAFAQEFQLNISTAIEKAD